MDSVIFSILLHAREYLNKMLDGILFTLKFHIRVRWSFSMLPTNFGSFESQVLKLWSYTPSVGNFERYSMKELFSFINTLAPSRNLQIIGNSTKELYRLAQGELYFAVRHYAKNSSGILSGILPDTYRKTGQVGREDTRKKMWMLAEC